MRLTALLLSVLVSMPALAEEVTLKDIQVIGRTLGFLEDVRSGPLDLGIVYMRGDGESLRQASAMKALLGEASNTGRLTLRPRLVGSDELPTLDHIGALFIVPDALQAGATAAATAKRIHVPVLSTDPACAEAGYCSLSLSTASTVEILLNRAAADEAGVHFTPAFRMLVKKI